MMPTAGTTSSLKITLRSASGRCGSAFLVNVLIARKSIRCGVLRQLSMGIGYVDSTSRPMRSFVTPKKAVGDDLHVGDCVGQQADFESASVKFVDSPRGRLKIGQQDVILPHTALEFCTFSTLTSYRPRDANVVRAGDASESATVAQL